MCPDTIRPQAATIPTNVIKIPHVSDQIQYNTYITNNGVFNVNGGAFDCIFFYTTTTAIVNNGEMNVTDGLTARVPRRIGSGGSPQ